MRFYLLSLTIGTQEAGVAIGYASSNLRILLALQTSQVLHISMNAQLTYEPIVL